MAKGSKRKLPEEETLEDEDVAGTSEDAEGEQDDGSNDETSNSEASSDSDDDGGEEDSEEDDEGDGDTVEVDLEFFDPSEKDFHGLKALLRTYLDDTDFSGCSELVDLIIQQRTVGTVVKTAENDDPIGVLTALSLARHRGRGCMRELRQFLLKRCKDADLAAKLQEAWAQEGTALVVSERLLNCPPQLAPPLHQALFEEEIPWAQQDEPSAEARDAFRFQRFLMASRVYADFSPVPASAQPGAPKAKRKKAERGKAVTVYARPEDEFYHKHCAWSYSFPASGKVVQKDELQPMRLVMLLLPNQAAAAREELNRVVGNVAKGMKPAT